MMKYNAVKLLMARIGIVALHATFPLAKKAPLPTESIMIDILNNPALATGSAVVVAVACRIILGLIG